MERLLIALFAVFVSSACSTWTAVHRHDAWTLYVEDGNEVDIGRFGCGLDRAFAAVEARMGPFASHVRVHCWDGDAAQLPDAGADPRVSEIRGELQAVPGIGPARVRAFHVKGGSAVFQTSGVFLGTCDVGTAVHELVHARIAEERKRLPLWFEEGLASFYGDGACFGGRWRFDGLACWPLRELRGQRLDDEELAHLLELKADDDYDARDNLLVHFVGWAIVFDLAREHPELEWRGLLEAFEREAAERGRLAAARARMEHTLRPVTESEWLERLRSADAGVRFAAAKGLWKLHNATVVDRMLDALEHEGDPEVKAGLALNILLATSETRLGRSRWGRMSALVFPVLREGTLPNEAEQQALRALYGSMTRWNSRRERNSQQALDDLSRFWEE